MQTMRMNWCRSSNADNANETQTEIALYPAILGLIDPSRNALKKSTGMGVEFRIALERISQGVAVQPYAPIPYTHTGKYKL